MNFKYRRKSNLGEMGFLFCVFFRCLYWGVGSNLSDFVWGEVSGSFVGGRDENEFGVGGECVGWFGFGSY